jgi:hypothetical protein
MNRMQSRIRRLERRLGIGGGEHWPLVWDPEHLENTRECVAKVLADGNRIGLMTETCSAEASSVEEAEALVARHRERTKSHAIRVVTELNGGELLAEWLPEIPDWVWDATEKYYLLPGAG